MAPQGARTGIMSKDNAGGPSGWAQFLQELLKTDIYKRSQGRIVRQFTCLAIWVSFALAAWQLFIYLKVVVPTAYLYAVYGVPTLVLALGIWIGFRVVNLPTFADFLIAVEAEMNKVSWPSRTELIRASMVVILLMFGLALVLFTYDTVLYWFLKHVLRIVA